MAFRILVADDHEVVRRGLCALLQAQPDWEVCGEAGDGREALDKAQRLKPDVIMAQSTATVAALKRETSAISIVFTNISDPIGAGFVASLSRPSSSVQSAPG